MRARLMNQVPKSFLPALLTLAPDTPPYPIKSLVFAVLKSPVRGLQVYVVGIVIQIIKT